MLRDQEHNYEVESIPNGFRIVPKETKRQIISYELNELGFWHFKEGLYANDIPAYNFYGLVDQSVDKLYDDWESPKSTTKFVYKIKLWAKKKTAPSLNHPIHALWKKEINSLNPLVAEVQRKCFSVDRGKGDWRNIEKVLMSNDKYILSDLINYRACRIYYLYESSCYINNDWLAGYSHNKVPYRSLNRTLMNLPGGIINQQLLGLQNFELPEPATSRIRLLAYLCFNNNYTNTEKDISVIARSTDKEIYEALKYMRHYFPNERNTNFRKTTEIIKTFGMIFDYLGSWNNLDILGLSKRSEEYHHNIELQNRIMYEHYEKQRIEREKELKKSNTALPKIALPENKSITFLDTYASVIDEGKTMSHCIASYAEGAVKGRFYLFHVDYGGEMASVEVNPKGYVVQSYGPKDRINSASKYGERILGEWAKQLQ
jgi:hypothetical protein